MTFPKYTAVTPGQWLSTPLDEKTQERTQELFNRLPLDIPGVERPSILDVGCGHGGDGSLYSLLKPTPAGSAGINPRSEWRYRGFDALSAKVEAFKLWSPQANVWVQDLYEGPLPEVDFVWCNLIKLGDHQAGSIKDAIWRMRAAARYGMFMSYLAPGKRGEISTYIHFEVHKPGELDIFYHCEVQAQ